MKKKLCITTFVFGNNYQEYIPIFIYSILKSYSDYYPLIFSHSRLIPSIRTQLELISDLGKFKVVEGFFGEHRIEGQRARAVRWLLDSQEFDQYKAVYNGDIDMFILPENPSLFEQHWENCATLRLPYSNIVRESTNKNWNLRNIKTRLIKSGFRSTFLSLSHPKMVIKKLSGLHFVKTREYFTRIRPLFSKYKKIILDKNYQNLILTKHHVDGFTDECLLYDMVLESGLGLPPTAPYEIYKGTFMLDYKNYKSPWFRPHHGIHLGIFRNKNLTNDLKEAVEVDFYKEYYHKFCQMTENDPVFQALKEGFSENIKNIFNRIHQLYIRV